MSKKKGKPGPKPKMKLVAKKAKAAKAAKPARVWKSNRGEERAAEAKARTKAPAQVPLIRGLRIPALDRVCAQIADTRAAQNRLRGEEADLERHAHKIMIDKKQMTWQSAGVELARVPGDEKLRVRTSRDNSTSTAPPVDDAGDEEEGTGQGVEGLPIAPDGDEDDVPFDDTDNDVDESVN